jgi:hypothetical protein
LEGKRGGIRAREDESGSVRKGRVEVSRLVLLESTDIKAVAPILKSADCLQHYVAIHFSMQ